jgi:hypothetical protein
MVKVENAQAVRWLLEKINEDVKARETHTPDHNKLSSYHTQFLFLPCEYKQGLPCHDLIAHDVERVRTAYTVDPYVMYEYDRGVGSYPIVLPYSKENGTKPAFIAGDLFKVSSPDLFYSLDSIRENGIKFNRKRVQLQLRSRKIRYVRDIHKYPEFTPLSNSTVITGWFTEYIKAWMYLGVPEYWNDLIDGGYMFRPVKRYVPNDGWCESYYHYRPNE